jgi:hypothetical protein
LALDRNNHHQSGMLAEHTVRDCLNLLRGPLHAYTVAQLAAARSRSTGEGYERALRLIDQSFVSLRGDRPDTLAICRVLLERWDLVFARRWSDTENHLIRRLKHARNRYAHEESFTAEEIEEFVNECIALAKAAGDAQCAAACAALLIDAPSGEPLKVPVISLFVSEGTDNASSESAINTPAASPGTQIHVASAIPRSSLIPAFSPAPRAGPFTPAQGVPMPQSTHGPSMLPASLLGSPASARGPVLPPPSLARKLESVDGDRTRRSSTPVTGAVAHVQAEVARSHVQRSAALYAEGEDLADFFETLGWRTVDKRSKGGCLWVLGDDAELEELVTDIETLHGISFESSAGGRASGYESAWFTKNPA